MTAEQRLERRHQALMQLVEYAKWMHRRDELVREAVDAGISKAEVAKFAGVHRSTVADIIARGTQNGDTTT